MVYIVVSWLRELLVGVVFIVLFFFFKQKTAYEMRISDWSSDVCSSDLRAGLEISGHSKHGLRCARAEHGLQCGIDPRVQLAGGGSRRYSEIDRKSVV